MPKSKIWTQLPFLLRPAMLQKYIDLVAAGDPNWESHEALKDYKEEEA